ncbi:hypothetical protein BX589_1497 [Paraburkholderia fungorum]|jgi:hypothetical protein|nr:hypothetical protein BX589_1497 [Paraburkholderia fungorum]
MDSQLIVRYIGAAVMIAGGLTGLLKEKSNDERNPH